MAARSLSLPPIATTSIAPLSPPSHPRGALRFRPSLLPVPISLAASSLVFPVPTRRSAAAIVFMLPTARPEQASAEKTPRWSSRAIKSFGMAEMEARKLKYPKTGTECLLLGILVEGTSEAAQFLRAIGITVFKVRDETVKLLGKSETAFMSPTRPPLTEPAQRVLDWAVDEKLKSGEDGEITTTHMLLAIWSDKESAGHKILASLGFDDQKASELAKSADKDVVMKYG